MTEDGTPTMDGTVKYPIWIYVTQTHRKGFIHSFL